jgi:hypothetical protein
MPTMKLAVIVTPGGVLRVLPASDGVDEIPKDLKFYETIAPAIKGFHAAIVAAVEDRRTPAPAARKQPVSLVT